MARDAEETNKLELVGYHVSLKRGRISPTEDVTGGNTSFVVVSLQRALVPDRGFLWTGWNGCYLWEKV